METVIQHIPFLDCGYDLFGSMASGRCSECGGRVQDSVSERRLIFVGRRRLFILCLLLSAYALNLLVWDVTMLCASWVPWLAGTPVVCWYVSLWLVPPLYLVFAWTDLEGRWRSLCFVAAIVGSSAAIIHAASVFGISIGLIAGWVVFYSWKVLMPGLYLGCASLLRRDHLWTLSVCFYIIFRLWVALEVWFQFAISGRSLSRPQALLLNELPVQLHGLAVVVLTIGVVAVLARVLRQKRAILAAQGNRNTA